MIAFWNFFTVITPGLGDFHNRLTDFYGLALHSPLCHKCMAFNYFAMHPRK